MLASWNTLVPGILTKCGHLMNFLLLTLGPLYWLTPCSYVEEANKAEVLRPEFCTVLECTYGSIFKQVVQCGFVPFQFKQFLLMTAYSGNLASIQMYTFIPILSSNTWYLLHSIACSEFFTVFSYCFLFYDTLYGALKKNVWSSLHIYLTEAKNLLPRSPCELFCFKHWKSNSFSFENFPDRLP